MFNIGHKYTQVIFGVLNDVKYKNVPNGSIFQFHLSLSPILPLLPTNYISYSSLTGKMI